MEKQYFEDLGQYGVRVTCDTYEGNAGSSFTVTIGEFILRFRGENKENEIVIPYPLFDFCVYNISVMINNDEEFKQFIEVLVEIDQYLQGQSYTPTFQNDVKEDEEIMDMRDLFSYVRKRGAAITEEMEYFTYIGHEKESYKEDKLFVRVYEDAGGHVSAYQSDDGKSIVSQNTLGDIAVFPNAETFDLRQEYIWIEDGFFTVLYAILDKENIYAQFPVGLYKNSIHDVEGYGLYGKPKVKDVYDLEEVEEIIKNSFEKAEIERQNKGLTMHAYNWLQVFGEESLKRDMLGNENKTSDVEKEEVFVYKVIKPVLIDDDDLPF